LGASLAWHPGRVGEAVLLAACLGLFVLLGKVRTEEIRRFASWGLAKKA